HTGHRGAGNDYQDQAAALAAFEAGELDLNSKITVGGQETSIGRLRYRFANVDEALLAVERGRIDMQDVVSIRIDGEVIQTSPGRAMFARIVRETLAEGGEVPKELLRYDTVYERGALRDLVVES